MKANELKEGDTIIIPSILEEQTVTVISMLEHPDGYIGVRFDTGEQMFFDPNADIVLDKKDDEP